MILEGNHQKLLETPNFIVGRINPTKKLPFEINQKEVFLVLKGLKFTLFS